MIFLLIIIFLSGVISFPFQRKWIRSITKEQKGLLLVWVLFFYGTLNFRKIASESLVVSNIPQLVAISLVAFCTFILFLLRVRAGSFRVNLKSILLLIYGIFGIASAAYSPYPSFSAYKASVIILAVWLCIISSSYKPHYDLARKFIGLCFFLWTTCVFSVILGAVISPELAFIYRPGMMFSMLSGWLIPANSNGVAMWAGVLALVGFNSFLTADSTLNKPASLSFFFVNLIVLVVAQSRTCFVGFWVGLLILLASYRRGMIYFAISFMVGLPLIFGYGFMKIGEDLGAYIKRGQSEQQLKGGSGRLNAWKYSMGRFKESPAMGYGFAAGTRFGAVLPGSTGSHLHNSYLEVLLNSGLIGFLPWISCLILTSKDIFKRLIFRPRWFTPELRNFHAGIAALWIFLLLRTTTGTLLVDFDPSFVLYLAIILYSETIRRPPNQPTVGNLHTAQR